MRLVTIQDHTSPGLLEPKELSDLAWGVGYQVAFHFNRSAWVEHGYAMPAHVVLLPRGVKVPVGAWNVALLDDSPEPGELGYHEDEAGTRVPFSEVFVKTARADGATPSSVVSHEVLELLVDPYVEHPRDAKHGGKLVILEVADPVEGCDYDVGAPQGRQTGVMVADWVEPAWFELAQSRPQLSFRSSVAQPFVLAPGGYISESADGGRTWTQRFGQARTALPAWASRLPRVAAG